jgi:hypothetical protein
VSPSIWLANRAIAAHVAVVILVPGFLALGWWQVNRAESGNALSYVYAVEWPLLAGYAVFMWWRIVHESVDPPVPGSVAAVCVDAARQRLPEPPWTRVDQPVALAAGVDDEDDPELADYNRYLAALHASGRRKHW